MKTTALFICLALGAATAAASAHAMELNAVVDVTPQGANFTAASPQEPVYYYPVTMGYEDIGDVGAWFNPATPPPAYNILHQMAQALASQGYLVVTRKSPPTIVLTFRWGRMAPASDFRSATAGMDDHLATLVGGVEKGEDLADVTWDSSKKDDFKRAASEARYFVIIEAFDYAASQKKNAVPLWCARISTPAADWSHPAGAKSLEEAMPALVSGVAPLLGHNVRPREFQSP